MGCLLGSQEEVGGCSGGATAQAAYPTCAVGVGLEKGPEQPGMGVRQA